MNINQKQSVLNQIDGYHSININELIADAYSGEPDFEKISLGNYNAVEFVILTNRMIDQLKHELEKL